MLVALKSPQNKFIEGRSAIFYNKK